MRQLKGFRPNAPGDVMKNLFVGALIAIGANVAAHGRERARLRAADGARMNDMVPQIKGFTSERTVTIA